MLYVQPDFYDDFHCIADRCRHSCCLGWEIDIDPDSMERYTSVGGELGEFLGENISPDPSPHFILGEGERCPMLRSDGLCRMIIELGEDSLCDICTEHPRFYNEYHGRLESGLGLCCEEVCRLLCEGNEPLGFEIYDDGEDEEAEVPELITLREKIFGFLADDGITMTLRMEKALALLGAEPAKFDAEKTACFYKSLERLDEGWTKLLQQMERYGGDIELEPRLSDIRYERIAGYFIYRHFAAAQSIEEAVLRLKFAFLSTMIVCCMDILSSDVEALRLYSAEIEYSDENTDKILDWISGR